MFSSSWRKHILANSTLPFQIFLKLLMRLFKNGDLNIYLLFDNCHVCDFKVMGLYSMKNKCSVVAMLCTSLYQYYSIFTMVDCWEWGSESRSIFLAQKVVYRKHVTYLLKFTLADSLQYWPNYLDWWSQTLHTFVIWEFWDFIVE